MDNQFLRRTNLTAAAASVLSRTTYGYDSTSRLATVNDGTNDTATYSHLANSPLVGQIVLANNGLTRMTTSRTYDFLNRLTQVSSAPSGAGQAVLSAGYNNNPANQRT